MTKGGAHPNYVAIWVWLVVLLGAGLAAGLLPSGRTVVVIVIFATAAVKALLVALNYMHLRFEPPTLYVLVLVPLLFAAVLAVALIPDFVLHR